MGRRSADHGRTPAGLVAVLVSPDRPEPAVAVECEPRFREPSAMDHFRPIRRAPCRAVRRLPQLDRDLTALQKGVVVSGIGGHPGAAVMELHVPGDFTVEWQPHTITPPAILRADR